MEFSREDVEARLRSATGRERARWLGELAWILRDTEWVRARELALEALSALRATDDSDVSGADSSPVLLRSLCSLAQAHLRLGEPEACERTVEEALALARRAHHPAATAEALYVQGLLKHDRGEARAALASLREATALQRTHGLLVGQARSEGAIGRVLERLGDLDGSQRQHQHAYELARQAGDNRIAALSLNNLAVCAERLGRYEQSLSYYAEALTLFTRAGDNRGEAICYHNIGSAYEATGEHERAIGMYERALGEFRGSGHAEWEIICLHSLGELLRKLRRNEEARRHLEEGLSLAEKSGQPFRQAELLLCLGRLSRAAETGQEATGRALLERALALASECQARQEMAEAHRELYELHKDTGRSADALRHHEEFHRLRSAVVTAESEERAARLAILHEVERSKAEAEIQRLRAVELAEANERIRRQAEELAGANEQLQALDREKSVLMGIAAHDLRSPLNGVVQAAELLVLDRDEPDRVSEYAGHITVLAGEMLELIEKLLSANAAETGSLTLSMRPIDLTPLLRRCAEAQAPRAHKKQIAVRLEIDRRLPAAELDAAAARQIFDNLLSNALKFSPAGREVTVRAFAPAADRVRIEVIDQGPGLTAEDRRRLFGRFARLSARPTAGEASTGLGLSIVKKLVELMGGVIACESEPGRGATFRLDWPAAPLPLTAETPTRS